MEGRGPYRIYDPGGGVPLGEASSAFERLVEENSRLKEKMQGIKMLGELLEESQMEASRLRQKAEELVKDSEPLPPSSPSLASFNDLAELAGKDTAVPATPADPAHPSDKPEPVPKPPSSVSCIWSHDRKLHRSQVPVGRIGREMFGVRIPPTCWVILTS